MNRAVEDQKKEDMIDENVTESPETDQESQAAGEENSGTEAGEEEQAETQNAGSDEGAEANAQAEKKSFFKKKKDKKDEQIEELTDRVKRIMAEFDNYRKRTEKEKASMYEVGVRSVFEKLLPIVDNFERGLATLDGEQKQEPFAVGMDKTYQLLLKMMDEMEVKPIEAVGKEFDPGLHNAVMHVEDEEAGENVVVEEFQKGYTYRDSVIRHSMVKVAN